MAEVKDFKISKGIRIASIFKQMKDSGGFNAKFFGQSFEILREMIKNKDCLKILTFPACIIATGCRGVIRDFVKNKWFDVVITTCGTLDHDIARSFKPYCHGSFDVDDAELKERGIFRIGNVFAPRESYAYVIEEKMREWLKEIANEKRDELASYELCWEIGKRIDDDGSILHWCYKNKIPVIVPGITDGAVGYQIWLFSQTKKFKIDILKDESLLNDLVWGAKKVGALIIGGGISKHHAIWWAQFADGLDYAVYITTASEYDGSLSGARTREAISWNKIKKDAKHVTIIGDATILLPILLAGLLEVV